MDCLGVCRYGCIPIVGIVVTISPSFSLYRIVVFPAASKPTIKILISFFPHSLSNNLENVRPILTVWASGLCCKESLVLRLSIDRHSN